MEFRFDINEIFRQPIVEIGHTLIPAGFKGDRRQLWDTISKVTDIVNAMGTASANAQGLTKSITTSDRLRNSDQQVLYLLVDPSSNQGKGAVTGMLKTGRKGLYVFDREGHHYQVQAPCILDFYVHESRQRSGLGKKLFEYMLQREEVDPNKLAIDRPSDKFLAFLNKHYTLNNPIRQMNNFVVYDGFFPTKADEKDSSKDKSAKNNVEESPHKGSNGLQTQILTSPYGRYGAPRPPCSMGQIIHNQSATVATNEQTGNIQTFPQYIPDHSTQPNDQMIVASQGQQNPTKNEQAVDEQPTSQETQGQNPQGNVETCKSQVGNGLPSISETERVENLKRVETTPPVQNTQDTKVSYHWPFNVPAQDYVYEKRFNHPTVPTLHSGIHLLLQPDQYSQEKQVAPAKEDIDEYGRPRSYPASHYNHYYYQYPQGQQATYPVDGTNNTQNYFAQKPMTAEQAIHQHYYPSVIQQTQLDPGQQRQYMEYLQAQQQAYELQQQQLWEQYQQWMYNQYMMQYPQWGQYVQSQGTQPQLQQQVPGGNKAETSKVGVEAPKPEMLIHHQTDPTRTKPRKTAVATPQFNQPMVYTPPVHTERATAREVYPPPGIPIPPTSRSVPTTPQIVQEPQVITSPQVPPTENTPTHDIPVPTSPMINEMTPEQQVIHYQNMLAQAQSRYPQQGAMPYRPFNPVFGIPPQPISQYQQNAQVIPPQATAQTVQEQPTPKEAHQVEQKDVDTKQGDMVAEKPNDSKTAGGDSAPSNQVTPPSPKPTAPYPYPIILKSNLEPLQPSVPLRRHSKPEVSERSSKSKHKIHPKSSIPSVRTLPSSGPNDQQRPNGANENRAISRQQVTERDSKVLRRVNSARPATGNPTRNNMEGVPSIADSKALLRKRSAIISEFLERLN